MTPEAQVALIVGILSAASALAGGLGGTAFGWYLKTRSEHRIERRNAFVDLLSAMSECQLEAAAGSAIVSGFPPGSTERLRHAERMSDALRHVNDATTVVSLILYPREQELLKSIGSACVREFALWSEATARKDHPKEDLPINKMWDSVLALAKKEIG